MAESIEIHHFGPIEEAIIPQLKQVNVFIGASGSGKSTIMKVIAMFQWLYKMQCIRSYLKYSGVKHIPFRIRVSDALKRTGLNVFLKPSTCIIYRNCNYEIVLSKGTASFKDLVPREELSLEKVAYISDKRVVISDMDEGHLGIRNSSFYLNDTFSNYKQALDAISSTEMPYLGLKLEKKKYGNTTRVFVTSKNTNEYSIPLGKASSGAQSSSPLHIIATYFGKHYNLVQSLNSTIFNYLANSDNLASFKADTNIGAFPSKRINLFVEEPELSLFPENQKGLLEYLISLCNHPREIPVDMNLTFATHSPYMLSSLNIMMLAKRASNKDNARAQDVVPQGYMLDESNVSAWEVKDSRVRSLIDEEYGLIDGTWLDSASDLVDDQIAALNDIIYG